MKDRNYFRNITYLMLETNSQCNLQCPTCTRSLLATRGQRAPKQLSISEFEATLTFFKHCPIDTIKLQGLSEPMLHPQFDQLAQNLHRYYPFAFIIIATNLQYHLQEAPFLATLPNVNMVYLSIDGVEDVYESSHPPASWELLLQNLSAIRSLVPEAESTQKLFINFTLTEKNYRQLPFIYQLVKDYNLAGVRINLAQCWDQDQTNPHQFSNEILAYLQDYKKDIKGVPNWTYQQCFWPFSGIVIDVYGNIRQCVLNTTQEPIGNIWQDNVEELYNQHAHYQEIRSQLKKDSCHQSCQTCDYKFLSPVLAQIFSSPLENKSPRPFLDEQNILHNQHSGAIFSITEDRWLEKRLDTKSSKLKYQFEWLEQLQNLSFIPHVRNLKTDAKRTSYQIKYYPHFETFANYLQRGANAQTCQIILQKVIEYLKILHQHAPLEIYSNSINEYLDTKLVNKIEECRQLDNDFNKLCSTQTIWVNGSEFKNLPVIMRELRPLLRSIPILEKNILLHGDITLENILVGNNGEILLLDPNNENLISSPLIDWAKLYQSLHSQYELLCKIEQISFVDNKISFYCPQNDLHQQLLETLNAHLTPEEQIAVLFHEAVHFARLLPYRMRANCNTYYLFYATMIKLLNEFVVKARQYENTDGNSLL